MIVIFLFLINVPSLFQTFVFLFFATYQWVLEFMIWISLFSDHCIILFPDPSPFKGQLVLEFMIFISFFWLLCNLSPRRFVVQKRIKRDRYWRPSLVYHLSCNERQVWDFCNPWMVISRGLQPGSSADSWWSQTTLFWKIYFWEWISWLSSSWNRQSRWSSWYDTALKLQRSWVQIQPE